MSGSKRAAADCDIDLTLTDEEEPEPHARKPRQLGCGGDHSIIDLTNSPRKPKPTSSSASLQLPEGFSRYESYELNYPTQTPEREVFAWTSPEPTAFDYPPPPARNAYVYLPPPVPTVYDYPPPPPPQAPRATAQSSEPPTKRQRNSASSSQPVPHSRQLSASQPKPASPSQPRRATPAKQRQYATSQPTPRGTGAALKPLDIAAYKPTAATQRAPSPPLSPRVPEPSVSRPLPATQPAPRVAAHTYDYPPRLPASQPVPQSHARMHAVLDAISTPGPSQAKKRRAKVTNDPPEEKRLARFKKACPKTILERVDRVREQRFFMIERRRTVGELKEEFDVLGSTGNVYTVCIDKMPSCTCPDSQKGNHCKHILFIFLKVLQVTEASGFWYQKALLSTELEQIFVAAPLAPNAEDHPEIRAALARAIGQTAGPDTSNKQKMPGPDDDCPICYDGMHGVDAKKLTFCDICHNALHKVCFEQWAKSKAGGKLTCVWCRATWKNIHTGGRGGVTMSEGYVNLADIAGISRERDTSSYHHGPRRGQRHFGYQPYGGGDGYDEDY